MVSQNVLLTFCLSTLATTTLANGTSVDDEMAHGRRQLRRSRSQRHTRKLDHRGERVIIRIDDEQKRGTENHDEDVPDWLRHELNALVFEDRLLQYSSMSLSMSMPQVSNRLDANADDLSTTPSKAPSRIPSLTPSGIPSDLPSLSPSTAPSSSPSTLPTRIPSLPAVLPIGVPSLAPTVQPFDLRLPLTESPSTTPSAIPTLQPFDFRLGAVPVETPTLQLTMVEPRIAKKDHYLDERIADGAGKGGKGKSAKGKGSVKSKSKKGAGKSSKKRRA